VGLKILLVDPPFYIFMGSQRFYYPLGLANIAALLNMNGHNTRIYDAEHSSDCKSLTWLDASRNFHLYPEALQNDRCAEWNNFSSLLKQFRPRVVGISALSVKVPAALILAAQCKRFDKNIIVVVGGDHATIAPQELLASPDIDFAVRGEGEYTMLELVTNLSEEKGHFEQIKGLSYKQNGRIVHNPPRDLISNLDALPFPAIDCLYDLENYRPVDLGLIMSNRGCPYSCTYCGVANTWSRRVRHRSAAGVISEIKRLKEKYGVTYFSFRDASFTVDRKYVLDFCNRLMEENLNISWECVTRLDLLDDELIPRMKSSGCAEIRVGIESGNEKLLHRMGRNMTLGRIREAARMLNRHDMYWAAYFMFGVTGETRETIADSLKLIGEIDPPFVTIARYSLIPGTAMYAEVKRLGLITEPVDWALESNQSLMKSYSQHLGHDEFKVLMEKAAEFVRRHNETHSSGDKKDSRLKI
jgi:anaerobic magnesium-protoporphyrin IX monomethyl ester cyclase